MAVEDPTQAGQTEEQNPFWRSTVGYLKSLPARIVTAPINAIKLPGRLLAEANGASEAVVSADAAQRQLASQITGQPVTPFSKGRQVANMLSLGLIPNNRSAAVDPSTLNPEQKSRFDQLGPMHQALLTASRPADFAKILATDEYFHDQPAEHEPLTDMGKANADAKHGLMTPYQLATEEAIRARKAAAPAEKSPLGSVDPTRFTPASLAEFKKTGDYAVLVPDTSAADRARADALALEYEKQSNRLELADAKAAAKHEKPPAKPDPYKIANVENTLQDNWRAASADARKAAVGFRQATANFGIKDPSNLSPGTMQKLSERFPKAFVDPSSRAARDMASTYFIFKTIDPGGRITDTETGLAKMAIERTGGFLGTERATEIVGNILDGESLTDQARGEWQLALANAFDTQFGAYDAMLSDARKGALRMRLGDEAAGRPGVPINPRNAIDDPLQDQRAFVARETGRTKDFTFPLADQEAEELLSGIYLKEHGKEPETAAQWSDFANSMGFRVDVMKDGDPSKKGPTGEPRADNTPSPEDQKVAEDHPGYVDPSIVALGQSQAAPTVTPAEAVVIPRRDLSVGRQPG